MLPFVQVAGAPHLIKGCHGGEQSVAVSQSCRKHGLPDSTQHCGMLVAVCRVHVHLCRRIWQYAARAVLLDVDLEGWPGSLRNRDRLAQRRQYIKLYQRKLQLARQQKASSQQLDPTEKVRSLASTSILTVSTVCSMSACIWHPVQCNSATQPSGTDESGV
jgi:hypothetical protein